MRNTNTCTNTRTNTNPLYRSFIGFDRLAAEVDRATRAQNQQKQPSWPPYNVELLDEDKYRISMAVSGFTEDELSIESQQNHLVVKGDKTKAEAKFEGNQEEDKAAVAPRKFLYQGISDRNFERKFQLGDFVKVVDAQLENGLLNIELEKEIPEALKPRKVSINSKGSLLETQQA